LGAWVFVALLLVPGQLAWLYLLRGPLLLTREATLVWGQVTLGAAAVAMLALLRSTPANAIRLTPRAGLAIVIGGTLALQAAAVFLLAPMLSDDLSRYRVDGRMWLDGTSPYATTPEAYFRGRAPDPVDALLPYRDWHSIYPPLSQLTFAAARWADDRIVPAAIGGNAPAHGAPAGAKDDAGGARSSHSRTAPGWRDRVADPAVRRHTVVFRSTFAAFAVAAVAILALALRRAGESPWYAAVLGWNPLLTLETGGMGHQDAVGVFLLAATLAAAASRRFRFAAVTLALACAVKPHAALLMPFLWRQAHEQRSFRAGRRVVLVFVATLAVAFLPPLLYQHGWAGWLGSASHFARAWEANALVYESFKALFGDGDAGRQMERAKDAARLVGLLVVLGMGMLLWQSRATLAEAGYWLFMLLMLVAPVVYPWYLAWVLVFVPMIRGPQGFAALTWAATAAMSYTIWRDATWIWSVPPRWLAAEYLPVLCVLAIEVLRLARVVPLGRAVQNPRGES
jgi:hypothetical protein